MSNTLRDLAQRAKNRLRAISNNTKEEKREHGNYNQACLSAKIQYAIISSQKKITDDPLYGKIKKMLAKDLDTMNPLSQIIEHDIYDGLSNAGKEKYMFKLSKRYATIKEHILGESSKDEQFDFFLFCLLVVYFI